MAEKVLRSRRRRKASKGRVLRVSDDVFAYLNRKRAKRSFDCLFRTLLGLPDREGIPQPLLEGWLEITSGRFFFNAAEARGEAVMAAARAKSKSVNKPLKMREVK